MLYLSWSIPVDWARECQDAGLPITGLFLFVLQGRFRYLASPAYAAFARTLSHFRKEQIRSDERTRFAQRDRRCREFPWAMSTIDGNSEGRSGRHGHRLTSQC
jgi:hypothetical protein